MQRWVGKNLAASRSQSAPYMHILVCICSNVRQFIITILL